jgi:uncharacterized protein YjbI with pentapeptide repeats
MMQRLKQWVSLGLLLLVSWAVALPAFAIAPQSFGYSTLVKRDFSGQQLRRAVFAKASLEDVNFTAADLVGAVMTGATMKRTSFQGANLANAMLDQLTLIDVDLSDAVLEDAIFLRSDFERITINGTDFTNTIFDGFQVKKLCQVATGVNSTTGVDTRESLGCPD